MTDYLMRWQAILGDDRLSTEMADHLRRWQTILEDSRQKEAYFEGVARHQVRYSTQEDAEARS